MSKVKSVITIEVKDDGGVSCRFDGVITKTELLRVQRFLKVSYKEALANYRRETRSKETTNAGTRKEDRTINTSSGNTTKPTTGKGKRSSKVSKANAGSKHAVGAGKDV